MEAAGCGGAGMRAVRQRNPTWALRCPAFPSLKYYSVRVERGERENRGAPCERALAAVFTPLSTYSRHPLVAGITRSFALAEGLLRRADIRVVIYFFSVHSPTYRKSQVPFVCLSVRSFVCSFISRGQSKSKRKKGGSVKKTEETPRRHQKARHLLKFVSKMANGNWV